MTQAPEHGRGAGPTEEPLTFPDTPTPSHAERARTLVAQRGIGTLGTLALDPAGFPYGSHVIFAMDGPSPVFLISRLAAHTKHLEADERASLMVAEVTEANPLASGRVTLVGRCRRLEQPAAARRAFLERHPDAAYYERFSDFSFFGLDVSAVRYIGGFGRMSWVDVAAWGAATPDPLAPHADDIVAHMNDDHADALVAYARAFTRARSAEEVTMTGVDRYGFELSVRTERGARPARVAFDAPVTTPGEVRRSLVSMVRRARQALE